MTTLQIRELAAARQLNITTLARKAALSYSTAHAIWHGQVTQIDLAVLDRLAIALDVRVADLFAGDPVWAEPRPRRPRA